MSVVGARKPPQKPLLLGQRRATQHGVQEAPCQLSTESIGTVLRHIEQDTCQEKRLGACALVLPRAIDLR